MEKINERELVLEVLLLITRENEYSHIALKNVLDKYSYLDKRQRSFIAKTVNGTLERLIEINAVINQFSTLKVNKIKPVIRIILQSSIYQMRYMDHVPDSAICNEAVKLAGKRGFKNLKGFVNGILRNISRNKDSIKLNGLSEIYSLPEWMIEMWRQEYSDDEISLMGQYFLKEAPLTVRFNPNKMTSNDLILKLESEGAKARPVDNIPCALEITKLDYLEKLESFRNGDFQVQDVSSMLTPLRAGVSEEDFIVDVCAAPGGKAIHFAELLNGTGMVEARDISEYKTSLIRSNIERSRLTNIRTKVWDAKIIDEGMIRQADIVAADLPCSGLGVLGRKADMKYKATSKSIQELAGLQREILKSVKEYVKPGGKLIYSTCTISRAENRDNAEWFEDSNADFEKIYEEQRLPGRDAGDGFYTVIFERTINE